MSTTAQSSSTTPATTLRPRAKRLISGLSEGDETDPQNFDSPPRRIQSPAPSPFDSRSASPIPAAHPQRSAGRLSGDGAQRFAGNSWGRRSQVGRERSDVSSPTSFGALWGSSWSALQAAASDFLGNDLPNEHQSAKGGKSKQRRPLGKAHVHNRISSIGGPSEWGPAAPTLHPITSDIGSGTREERESAVRAQKRKDMLTRADSSYADALGKFKRRLSDDHESMSAPPAEDGDRAALVYIHHVKKDDTLAGITIKYNCSAAVVRKANRMWPNDTVQSRQPIILPVDSCGVKGKPCAGPEQPSALDLLAQESPSAFEAEEVPTPKASQPPQNTALTNGNAVAANHDTSQRARAPSITIPDTDTSRRTSTSTTDAGEPPWHHDSWVMLSGFSAPTEIARLSRRSLGYFPPARRKSLNFSDMDTPSASLDLGRRTSDLPSAAPKELPQRPSGRPRRLSNAGNGYFPSYMAGPGGVGTMSTNVRFPGPAQDGLNKMFAKHLPDVAPPKFQSELHPPETPLYHDEPTPTGSGTITPSLLPNQQSTAAGSLGLAPVGGAIEGWLSKWTSNMMSPAEYAAHVAQQKQQRKKGQLGPRTSVGAPGKGIGGVGDLIEMTDEFELGTDEDEEEDSRGRPKSAIYLGQGDRQGDGASGSGASYLGGGGVKGRTVSATSKGKSGKDD